MATEDDIFEIGKQMDAFAKNDDAASLLALHRRHPTVLAEQQGKAYWTLCTAIENGAENAVKTLLTDIKLDPNYIPLKFYEPPVYKAVTKNQPGILQLLIDNGAKIDVLSNAEQAQSSTPLSQAIFYSYTECAKILIDAGANLDPASCDNRSLYCWASGLPELEMIHAKLQGHTVNHQDDRGKTAMHFAARDVKLEKINYLIACGALVAPACHDKGSNALHSFISAAPFGPMGMSGMTAERYCTTLEVLLAQATKEGLSADCPDKKGTTPLMYVATHEIDDKSLDLAKKSAHILSAHGCKADTADDKGQTALHYAMEVKNYRFAKFLCAEMGADPHQKDKENRCALDYFVDVAEAAKCAEELRVIFQEKLFSKIARIITEDGTSVKTAVLPKMKLVPRAKPA